MRELLAVLDFLTSLPSWMTALVVVALSLAIVFALSLAFLNRWLFVPAAIVPFAIAYCTYWAPTWRGEDVALYAPWASMFIATWFAAGAVACSTMVALLLNRRTIKQRASLEREF